jgi:TolA-binding protein
MSRTLAARSSSAPPPFWQQLPKVFTYPANGDALVKIAAFGIGGAVALRYFPLGVLWYALAWLGFTAYCFGILERTARGHLVAAQVYHQERTDRDWRPVKQIGVVFVFMFAVGMVTVAMGQVAGQVALLAVSLAMPASIMVLALEEKMSTALNPARILATIAGIGMPYLALCAFLFLLLESGSLLAGVLAKVLPAFASLVVAQVVTMYFMVSMYYLMGYALFQNHEALGIDVQVESAEAQRALERAAGTKVPADVLGPETRGLVADGRLPEARARIEERMKREWDDNKLHDQYQKVLVLEGDARAIARHVNEYVPKLAREKKLARAVDVYEAGRKAVPDLLISDSTLLVPLATQASELRRDKTAFELLKGFDKRFPESADIPAAYMLAAKILLERMNDYGMAQKIFAHLAKKYPQHPLAAEATKLADVAGRMAAQPAPG